MKDSNSSPADLITQLAAKREYGLTPDLFALLPEPILKWQPGGRTPLRLYRVADIRQMLQSPEAQQLIERAKAKRAAAAKANVKKEEKKVLASVAEITVQRMDLEMLAVYGDDTHIISRYLPLVHELELPEGFEPRVPVFTETQLKNALRYILSHLATYNTDWFAKGLAKDAAEYFKLYRYAVLNKIAEAYPELKEVCERRKDHFC